jgi:hypothetical protein
MHIPATAAALLAALAESPTAPEPATPSAPEPELFTDAGPPFDVPDLSPAYDAAAREARLRAEIRKALAEVKRERENRALLARLLAPPKPPAQGDVFRRRRSDYRGEMGGSD